VRFAIAVVLSVCVGCGGRADGEAPPVSTDSTATDPGAAAGAETTPSASSPRSADDAGPSASDDSTLPACPIGQSCSIDGGLSHAYDDVWAVDAGPHGVQVIVCKQSQWEQLSLITASLPASSNVRICRKVPGPNETGGGSGG